jgi:hypothetical protein
VTPDLRARLDALVLLEQQATPGPWVIHGRTPVLPFLPAWHADAEFIVALRNIHSELIAEVVRLEQIERCAIAVTDCYDDSECKQFTRLMHELKLSADRVTPEQPK